MLRNSFQFQIHTSLSWDKDDSLNKDEFRKQFPDVKHPDKRISGWRKSLIAQEEKRVKKAAKRKAAKDLQRNVKKKKRS